MLESENLAGVMVECERDPEVVDQTSWARCSNYYFMQSNRGLSRFWSQWQIAFDEPFRSYVTAEFSAARVEQE